MKELLKMIKSKIEASNDPFREYEGDLIENEFDNSQIFITGVGRSGTHFLAKLFGLHSDINAFHLDEVGNSVADSFLMYCKWYGLQVDNKGFLSSRNYLIKKSEKVKRHYLESNPYLALSIDDLSHYYEKSKIIISIRDPRKVVLSHYNKGWYKEYYPNFDTKFKAPGYQYNIKQSNHFFGRIMPNEKHELEKWLKLTQVGKITWMWVSINNHIYNSLKSIDESKYMVIDINEFDYVKYQKLADFIGLKDIINDSTFNELRNSKVGKTKKKKYLGWDEKEEEEFNDILKDFSYNDLIELNKYL